MHRIIKCDQKTLLKSYVDMNTDLRKKSKITLERDFLKVVKWCSFWKKYAKCRRTQRYQTCNKWKRKGIIYYQKQVFFSENLLTIEVKEKKLKYTWIKST